MKYIDRNIKDPRYSLAKATGRTSYSSDVVKKHLIRCYGLKCCYCESSIDSASYWEVEHFYPKSIHTHLITEIKNLHLACKRCNVNKENFNGPSISPNFYQDAYGTWKETTDKFIYSNISYVNEVVTASPTYATFVSTLKLNGSSNTEVHGLHLAVMQNRAEYLNETTLLLDLCVSLASNNLNNEAADLFNIVAPRFKAKAKFSTMISQNLGSGFLTLGGLLRSRGCRVSF